MGVRRFLFAFACLAWAVLAVGGAGAGAAETGGQAFLTEIEDLPLMPGLSEAPDSAVVFDSASGRIVVVDAAGSVGGEAVFRFYAESLPQLGWRPEGQGRFRRDGETLTLEIVGGGPAALGRVQGMAGVTVRFSLFSEMAAEPARR